MNSPRSATTQSRNFTKTAASPPLQPSRSTIGPGHTGRPAGGDAETNAGIIRSILAGETKGPKREAVLLNTGAALFVANAADSISAGVDLAATVIDDGRASAAAALGNDMDREPPILQLPVTSVAQPRKVGGNSNRY